MNRSSSNTGLARWQTASVALLVIISSAPATRAEDPATGKEAPAAGAAAPAAVTPQDMLKQQVASAKQAAAENHAALMQYTWVERTTLNLKGEDKNTSLAQCSYDANGKLQKAPLTEPEEPEKKRGLRGKAVEGKIEDMKAYMEQVKTLIGEYVPPAPTRMQEAFAAGHAALSTPGASVVQIKFTDYAKPGDKMTLHFDSASKKIRKLDIASTLENKDPVTMSVEFQTLPDGTNYTGLITVAAPAKEVQVKMEQISFAKVAR